MNVQVHYVREVRCDTLGYRRQPRHDKNNDEEPHGNRGLDVLLVSGLLVVVVDVDAPYRRQSKVQTAVQKAEKAPHKDPPNVQRRLSVRDLIRQPSQDAHAQTSYDIAHDDSAEDAEELQETQEDDELAHLDAEVRGGRLQLHGHGEAAM